MSQEWDWDTLLADALKAGLSVAEFWDLTPKELRLCFEADQWRQTQQVQRDAWLAWHIAALSRTKRLPPLRQMLLPMEAKPLRGAELERRREEHKKIVERLGHGRR